MDRRPEFHDQPVRIRQLRCGEFDRYFEIKDNARDSRLCFGDADLLQQMIADSDGMRASATQAQPSALYVEEDSIRRIHAIGGKLEISGRLNHYPSGIVQCPKPNGGNGGFDGSAKAGRNQQKQSC